VVVEVAPETPLFPAAVAALAIIKIYIKLLL
jgi:hypothetical protein